MSLVMSPGPIGVGGGKIEAWAPAALPSTRAALTAAATTAPEMRCLMVIIQTFSEVDAAGRGLSLTQRAAAHVGLTRGYRGSRYSRLMFEAPITGIRGTASLRPLEPHQAEEFAAHMDRAREHIRPWVGP